MPDTSGETNMRESELRKIFEKTNGHCHFCGDPVEFSKRGWAEDLTGFWEVDHVIQRGKNGAKSAENCLPACTQCNRLRWHRSGDGVRELLLLGLVARDEIRKKSKLGVELNLLRKKRLERNQARRKQKSGKNRQS